MISTASPPASADTHGLVVLGEVVRELLVGRLLEDGLLPQVGGRVGVSGGHGGVGRLGEVAEGAGGAAGGGVAVVDPRHLQQLLGDGGRDDAGTAGGGDETHPDGAALAGHLAGHGVRPPDLVAPEAAPHGHDGELGEDDGAADGGGHLLGALHTQTHVAVVVTDSDESLEPSPLTGPGLLLHGHDLQHLILESGTDEHVDDLVLFDGQRVEVDLLQALDLAVLHQAAQLGHRDPLLVLLAPASSAAAAASPTSSAATSTASVAETSAKSSSVATSGWSSVRHCCLSDVSREPED